MFRFRVIFFYYMYMYVLGNIFFFWIVDNFLFLIIEVILNIGKSSKNFLIELCGGNYLYGIVVDSCDVYIIVFFRTVYYRIIVWYYSVLF